MEQIITSDLGSADGTVGPRYTNGLSAERSCKENTDLAFSRSTHMASTTDLLEEEEEACVTKLASEGSISEAAEEDDYDIA